MNNQVTEKGYVGKDPETKTLQNGLKLATYSLAVNRQKAKDDAKPVTDWFNVVAWGDQAEIVSAYIKKGSRVRIFGKLQTNTYEDKDGKKITTTNIVQDEISVVLALEKKPDTGSIHGDDLPF